MASEPQANIYAPSASSEFRHCRVDIQISEVNESVGLTIKPSTMEMGGNKASYRVDDCQQGSWSGVYEDMPTVVSGEIK